MSVRLQGSAKRCSPGYVNAAGKAGQKWQATAGTKFTKTEERLLADLRLVHRRPPARRSSLISIRVITPASILILNPSEDGGRGTARAQTHLKYAIMSLAEKTE